MLGVTVKNHARRVEERRAKIVGVLKKEGEDSATSVMISPANIFDWFLEKYPGYLENYGRFKKLGLLGWHEDFMLREPTEDTLMPQENVILDQAINGHSREKNDRTRASSTLR